jgi:transposase
MARPYPEDLRLRIVRAVEGGLSRNAAAKRFDVSISCVVKLMQRWTTRGTVAPDPVGGGEPALAPHEERVRALVAETPDATLDEPLAKLAADGIESSRPALCRFLRARGVTRKKSRPTPRSRRARTSPPPAPPGARPSRG